MQLTNCSNITRESHMGKKRVPVTSSPSSLPGPGGASEAGAEGGGPRSEGGPQEDFRHPETAVRPGAADAAL